MDEGRIPLYSAHRFSPDAHEAREGNLVPGKVSCGKAGWRIEGGLVPARADGQRVGSRPAQEKAAARGNCRGLPGGPAQRRLRGAAAFGLVLSGHEGHRPGGGRGGGCKGTRRRVLHGATADFHADLRGAGRDRGVPEYRAGGARPRIPRRFGARRARNGRVEPDRCGALGRARYHAAPQPDPSEVAGSDFGGRRLALPRGDGGRERAAPTVQAHPERQPAVSVHRVHYAHHRDLDGRARGPAW